MLGFFHFPTACPASVNGTNNKLNDATSKSTPMMSSSVHMLLRNLVAPSDFHGYSGTSPALEAFRWLIQSEVNSGSDRTGVMIALAPKT